MNNQPDRNDDFDYPPLTARDFEEIMHFYKHDGKMIEVDGKKATITITLPLVDEASFKVLGHRIGIIITSEYRNVETKVWPCLDGNTEAQALGKIVKAARVHLRGAAA